VLRRGIAGHDQGFLSESGVSLPQAHRLCTIEVIPREAIQGFYDTDDMSITGMYRTIRDNVYERYEEPESESDGDFSYEDYTTADDESVSLVDSDANDTEDEE